MKDLRKLQIVHHQALNNDAEGNMKTWFNARSTDTWRHNRMREMAVPVKVIEKIGSVLTVGDGRFGTDANYFLEKGIQRVVASDVQTDTLESAAKKGKIKDYLRIDLMSDEIIDTYDLVFCKETLHHLNLPQTGIINCIKRSSKLAVFIEPAGCNPVTLRGKISLAFYRLFRKRPIFFEPSGNYVYEFRTSELEQLFLANYIDNVYYRFFDDHYIEGVENDNFELLSKIKRIIFLKGLRSALMGWSKGMIIFIVASDSSLGHYYEKEGFKKFQL